MTVVSRRQARVIGASSSGGSLLVGGSQVKIEIALAIVAVVFAARYFVKRWD